MQASFARTVRLLPLVLIAAVVAACVQVQAARGQCLAEWVPGDGEPGVDGQATVVAALPNGDVIAGGYFLSAGGKPAQRIARYSFASNTWSALGSGLNGYPAALVALPGGEVIVGGSFSNAGGVAVNNIARYDSTTGVWSALGSGTSAPVTCLAVGENGDVLVGGTFTLAGGLAVQGFARFNPVAGAWSTLGVVSSSSVRVSSPKAILELPGGDVLIAGEMRSQSQPWLSILARYRPTTGTWSNLGVGTVNGSGFNGQVNTMVRLPDGDVMVGGSFTTAGGGIPARYVARCNPVTGNWSATGAGTNYAVLSAAVLPGGDVLVGSSDLGASEITRYNSALGTWSPVSNRNSIRTLPHAIAAVPGSQEVIVCATVSSVGFSASGIARWNAVSNAWSVMGQGANGTITDFALLSNGDVIVAGEFSSIGGIRTNRVARYSTGSGGWSDLGGAFSEPVLAVAPLPHGDAIVGGSFTSAGGVPVNRIARYTLSTGAWTPLGSGVAGTVAAIVPLPNGEVVVGGNFYNAGGVSTPNIARLNPATSSWSALGSGVNGPVSAMAVLPGGDIIVGGRFTMAGATPAKGVARLNPATGTWSAFPDGITVAANGGTVNAILVLPDGDVILAGEFIPDAVGRESSNIVRLNVTTGVWSSLRTADADGNLFGAIRSLALLSGGDVLVGGTFARIGGNAASRIARLNPSSGVWSALASGTNGDVNTICVLPGGDFVVGGAFTSAGGLPSASLARYSFGSIIGHPNPTLACPGAVSTFAVATSGSGPYTYRWQIQTAPPPLDTWQTLSDGAVPLACGGSIEATNSASSAVGVRVGRCPGDSTLPQQFRFRCIVDSGSGSCGEVLSNAATLTDCPADFNCDRKVSVLDTFDLLNAWFAGSPVADFDSVSGLSVNDVLAFLNAWFTGC